MGKLFWRVMSWLSVLGSIAGLSFVVYVGLGVFFPTLASPMVLAYLPLLINVFTVALVALFAVTVVAAAVTFVEWLRSEPTKEMKGEVHEAVAEPLVDTVSAEEFAQLQRELRQLQGNSSRLEKENERLREARTTRGGEHEEEMSRLTEQLARDEELQSEQLRTIVKQGERIDELKEQLKQNGVEVEDSDGEYDGDDATPILPRVLSVAAVDAEEMTQAAGEADELRREVSVWRGFIDSRIIKFLSQVLQGQSPAAAERHVEDGAEDLALQGKLTILERAFKLAMDVKFETDGPVQRDVAAPSTPFAVRSSVSAMTPLTNALDLQRAQPAVQRQGDSTEITVDDETDDEFLNRSGGSSSLFDGVEGHSSGDGVSPELSVVSGPPPLPPREGGAPPPLPPREGGAPPPPPPPMPSGDAAPAGQSFRVSGRSTASQAALDALEKPRADFLSVVGTAVAQRANATQDTPHKPLRNPGDGAEEHEWDEISPSKLTRGQQ